MNQQRQPSISTLWREIPAAAPHLTRKHTCSACEVEAIEAGDGDLIVCPKCFGLLWHRDWDAAERKRKAEIAAANRVAHQKAVDQAQAEAAERRHRREKPIALTAEDVVFSPPTLGSPLLGLKHDDD
jgi:hypothetical protein